MRTLTASLARYGVDAVEVITEDQAPPVARYGVDAVQVMIEDQVPPAAKFGSDPITVENTEQVPPLAKLQANQDSTQNPPIVRFVGDQGESNYSFSVATSRYEDRNGLPPVVRADIHDAVIAGPLVVVEARYNGDAGMPPLGSLQMIESEGGLAPLARLFIGHNGNEIS